MSAIESVHFANGIRGVPYSGLAPIGWIVEFAKNETHGDWKTAMARNLRDAKKGERGLLTEVFFNLYGQWAKVRLEDGSSIDVPPTSLIVTSTARHSQLPPKERPIGDVVKVSTLLTENGVEQLIDVAGHVARKVVDVAALQLDQAVRAKLIELGWTPPKDGAA